MFTVAIVVVALLAMVILLRTASMIGQFKFNQNVNLEVNKLFQKNIETNSQIVQKADLEGLPICVQKWLDDAKVVGKERIRAVRLKQKAVMRLNERKPWMPTEVEQYFTVDRPGFIWKAHIKVTPFFHIAGRDKYEEGNGNMLIKLLSLITVANSVGKEIDQGTLLRFLAETMWFPTAALSSYIQWEEINSHTVKATMNFKGVSALGIFTFNEKGEVVSFGAKRYMEVKGSYSLEDWLVVIKEHKEFQGVKIPAKGEVVWKLKTGDFSWYHFEITEIEYNVAEVWLG